jgi:hypothetical protein
VKATILSSRSVKLPAGLKSKKPSKYRNKKTVYDGITFDSNKEAARWLGLKAMWKTGLVFLLERQVPYDLRVNDVLICRYIADFVYHDAQGKLIVEDVKSEPTRKKKEYRIKYKLMQAIHGITITEV